jgi:hypothetical protein
MTLKTSVVIFQALETSALCSLIDLGGLCNLTGLKSLYNSISSTNIQILIV